MASAMDKPMLEYIMRGLTTRDRALQRHIADLYLAPDIKLTHVLGDVQGREAFYAVYRAAVTGLDYKLRIIDIVLDAEEGKAACWVDLNLKIAPLYLKRYHAPTLVMLSWRRDEDGLCRITEQIDHHSLFVVMWVLGWPLSEFFDLITRPITGRLISLTGWGVDALEDATTAAVDLGASAVGWGMTQTLPGPVLDSLANKILPSAWSSKLGLLRPCSVEPAVVQQQAVETGSSNGGVVNAPSITTPAQQQMQLQRRAVVVPAHGSVSA